MERSIRVAAEGASFWSAPAERSGDGAFARVRTATAARIPTSCAAAESKAAWRFASRGTPKCWTGIGYAASQRGFQRNGRWMPPGAAHLKHWLVIGQVIR